ncbi:MAG: family 43 glycosylhydrolase [Bacilli bacterium]|nr:family 43 glycosylhydrolase [Bacilli bacterium]
MLFCLSACFVPSLLLTSCSSMAYNAEIDITKGYNKNLWFLNTLETETADPSIIDGEDGYYYMYGTTDDLSTAGFYVYRSKQLNYWENLGPCFLPDPSSWSCTALWAPNVIKIGDLYYMYYSASNYKNPPEGLAFIKGMSVAVSSTPYGPFKEYEGLDYYGNLITKDDQVFDEIEFSAIDPSVFVDTDGSMYLYFSRDQYNSNSISYGVKMLDPVTLDMSTLKPLAKAGFAKYDDPIVNNNLKWEIGTRSKRWNEAPYLYKSGDKYYLFYSANYFGDMTYGVGYAISSSPLGDFEKPCSYESENLFLGLDQYDIGSGWDFMSGTGHHCFFEVGDELMIGYHAHVDREYGNSERAFAFDRVVIKEDGSMHANGPSYSLQPLPSKISGLKNVALDAKITSSSNDDVKKLNDYMIPFHFANPKQSQMQFALNKGSNTITLSFENEVNLSAIAIYNAVSVDKVTKEIKSIDFGGSSISGLKMAGDYYQNYFSKEEEGYLRPGAPFVAEFNPLKTNKVTITIDSQEECAISEIVMLGGYVNE